MGGLTGQQAPGMCLAPTSVSPTLELQVYSTMLISLLKVCVYVICMYMCIIYVRAHMRMCVCVHVCACLCRHARRLKTDRMSFYDYPSSSWFGVGGPSLNLEPAVSARLADQRPPGTQGRADAVPKERPSLKSKVQCGSEK